MKSRQHTSEALHRLMEQAKRDGSSTQTGGRELITGAPSRPKKRVARPVEGLKILYSVAVWGAPYVDIFLALSLPSLLSNLADLPNNSASLFVIHTRPEDQIHFDNASQFQALKSLMPVIFCDIKVERSKGSNKYNYLSNSQSEAIKRAPGFDAIVFLYADFIWGVGAIYAGLRRMAEGYDAVVLPVPPLIREDFIETVARDPDDFFDFDGGYPQMALPSRRLVALGKKLLHPLMRDNTVDYEDNTSNPAYVLWLGPNDDYLIRCFHIHPLILRVQNETPEFWLPLEGTLDEYFIPQILKAADRVYHVPDSDEAAIVSLTPQNFPVHYLPDGCVINADEITRWAEAAAAPIHKMFFDTFSIWHAHDIDREAWQPVISRSERLAAYVKSALLLPDSVLRAEDKLNWSIRYDRTVRMQPMRGRGSWQQYFVPWPLASSLSVEILARIWKILPEILRRQIRTNIPQRFSDLARRRVEKPRLHRAPIHLLVAALVVSAFRKD